MKTLVISLVFVLSLPVSAHAGWTKLNELRDLTVFMRLPDQVCAESKGLEVQVRAEGHLAYDELLKEIKDAGAGSASSFSSKARRCQQDCTCQIFEELEELFPKGNPSLLEKVKSQSQAMTDKDYGKCAKRLHLNCRSKPVKAVMDKVKAESAASAD